MLPFELTIQGHLRSHVPIRSLIPCPSHGIVPHLRAWSTPTGSWSRADLCWAVSWPGGDVSPTSGIQVTKQAPKPDEPISLCGRTEVSHVLPPALNSSRLQIAQVRPVVLLHADIEIATRYTRSFCIINVIVSSECLRVIIQLYPFISKPKAASFFLFLSKYWCLPSHFLLATCHMIVYYLIYYSKEANLFRC